MQKEDIVLKKMGRFTKLSKLQSNQRVIRVNSSTERFQGGEFKHYDLEEKIEWYLNNTKVSDVQIVSNGSYHEAYIIFRRKGNE